MTDILDHEPAPWSRPLAVSDTPARGLELEIVANAAQRAALAPFCGLASVEDARAIFQVTRRGRDGLRVRGRVSAHAQQICGVSLEPFAVEIAEEISVDFAPERAPEGARPRRGARDEAPAIDLSLDSEDGPEPIVGGKIDLGAIATEFLALGVDPYPRKPGAAFSTDAAASGELSPFSALKSLKGGDDKR